MGNIRIHYPVKIIAAVTFSPDFNLAEIYKLLESLLSPIDLRSSVYEFKFTDYYEAEMGADLKKQMLSFENLVPPEKLPDIKIAANQIEAKYLSDNGRTVNIDPGYITAAKLILATTKDYDHRIYLNRGIFGDVHLRFQDKSFQPNEWTYPDYRQPEILEFFKNVRTRYMEQLRFQPAD